MTIRKNELGERSAAVVVAVSLLLGAGAAAAAVTAVVSSSAPDDISAVTNGPAEAVPPGDVIHYGG